MLTGFKRLSSKGWPELREEALASLPFPGPCVELVCVMSKMTAPVTDVRAAWPLAYL